MASEIRVNKINNRAGLGTVTYTDTGIIVSGISSASNFKTGSSDLHSTGLTVGDSFVHSTGVNLGAGVTFSNNGNATFSGIVTALQFKGDGSQLSGIDASALKFGASTKVQATNTGAVVTGILTATSFSGDGSNLSGLASRDFYGFEVVNENLFVKYTNSGADNISLTENASFREDFIGPTGYTFSINNAGELEMTI